MIVVMIPIGLILERTYGLVSLRYQRLSATGSSKHTAVELAPACHKDSFMADQRGAVAFETLIVWLFLMMTLLLPLADLAIAGFKFTFAYQALRNMGQRTQYSVPDATDPASISSWKSSLPTTVDGYPIDAKVYCGDPGTEAPCAGATWPKYYTFTTSFTLSPMMLRSVLCSTCTVNYSQRYQ
jgi:hypothetical protein